LAVINVALFEQKISVLLYLEMLTCTVLGHKFHSLYTEEKISWTDHVRNEEVLLRVNEQRNILHEIRKWTANWIGHILRRNCLLKHVIEGKIKERWK
jgi:hypothetical protein